MGKEENKVFKYLIRRYWHGQDGSRLPSGSSYMIVMEYFRLFRLSNTVLYIEQFLNNWGEYDQSTLYVWQKIKQ
jgi:hypothetical protein